MRSAAALSPACHCTIRMILHMRHLDRESSARCWLCIHDHSCLGMITRRQANCQPDMRVLALPLHAVDWTPRVSVWLYLLGHLLLKDKTQHSRCVIKSSYTTAGDADNSPDSSWAVAGPDNSPSWHHRLIKVHSQQLHAHCDLQDCLLLLLPARGLWHAHIRHH